MANSYEYDLNLWRQAAAGVVTAEFREICRFTSRMMKFLDSHLEVRAHRAKPNYALVSLRRNRTQLSSLGFDSMESIWPANQMGLLKQLRSKHASVCQLLNMKIESHEAALKDREFQLGTFAACISAIGVAVGFRKLF
jgi:hypothetical protein